MAAHAIVLHNQKILLLLSDSNPKQEYPNDWTLIGGQEEPNETPEQTFLREFKEETTISPHRYQFLTEVPEGNSNLFLVELSDGEARSVKVGNEGVELRFFTQEEFKQLPLYKRLEKKYPDYLNLFIDFLT